MRSLEDRLTAAFQGAVVGAMGLDGTRVFTNALSKSDTTAAIAFNSAGAAISMALVGCIPLGLYLAFKKDAPRVTLK